LTETKTLEIKGTTYTIQRFGFEEGGIVDDLVAEAKDRIKNQQAMIREQQAINVFYGTVEPKFESIQAVKEADREVVLHLWLEISKFNQYETSFLLLLRNLPLQVSQPEKTLTQ
jgi:hypothetical protein